MIPFRSVRPRFPRCLFALLLLWGLLGFSTAQAELIEAPLAPPPASSFGMQQAKPIPLPKLNEAQLAELIARMEARPSWIEDVEAVVHPGLDSPLDARPGFFPTTKNLSSVSDTTQYPYRTVVKLVLCFDNNCYNAGVCSGSIMAPGWVMTAAHCVYDTDRRQQIRSVEITPARAGNSAPYGKTHGTRVFYPSQWSNYVDHPDYEYDAALIEMGDNLIDSHLGWAYSSNLRDYHTTIYTAGYPATTYSGYHMYEKNCEVNYALNGMLLLACNSEGGQSGSAAWWTRNGPQESVGILSFGTDDNQTGIIRLRPELLSAFYSYMGHCQNQCASVGESVCETDTRLKYCTWSEETYCYTWSYRDCPNGGVCQNDRCQCIPDCDGKECGPDGCGGTCGNCGEDALFCEPDEFVCVECVQDRDCGYGKVCLDNACTLSEACLEICEDRECGRVQGCACGSCPENRPICNNHRCIPDPNNPIDGDEADGDDPDEENRQCVGTCFLGEAPFCANLATFCQCDGRQWIPKDCGMHCRDLGGVSVGCDFNPTRSLDGCHCVGIPDTPTQPPDEDGDLDDEPPVAADGGKDGCNHAGGVPAAALLLLCFALILRRGVARRG